MNAIILKSSHKLNGTLFDAFEYFICLLENYVDVKLIVIGDSRFSSFFEIFEEKYNIDDIKWKDKIVLLKSKADLLKYKFKNLLLIDYTTIDYCYDVLTYDKLSIITNKIQTKIKNASYYTELYDTFYFDFKYKGKFLFNRYKEIKKCKRNTFVNLLGNKNDLIKHINKKEYILKSNRHVKNIYSEFDEYVYISDGSIFDCHPRMFHECYFYNKKIEYINLGNSKDGAYYRYNDLCENGLKDRILDSNDSIIKTFL